MVTNDDDDGTTATRMTTLTTTHDDVTQDMLEVTQVSFEDRLFVMIDSQPTMVILLATIIS